MDDVARWCLALLMCVPPCVGLSGLLGVVVCARWWLPSPHWHLPYLLAAGGWLDGHAGLPEATLAPYLALWSRHMDITTVTQWKIKGQCLSFDSENVN